MSGRDRLGKGLALGMLQLNHAHLWLRFLTDSLQLLDDFGELIEVLIASP